MRLLWKAMARSRPLESPRLNSVRGEERRKRRKVPEFRTVELWTERRAVDNLLVSQ